MTTSSQAELSRTAARLAALPGLPRDVGGPVFALPWHAQAFALAVTLSERGLFTWAGWTAALSAQIQTAGANSGPDDGSRYYDHWLAALECLALDKGLCDVQSLQRRREAWAQAYRRTPHGAPVTLEAADSAA
jgi:nitrile hydratase accessory protein